MDFDTDLLSSNAAFSLHNAADPTKQKCFGFGFLKQDRAINEEDLREFKISKTSSCGEGLPRYPLHRSNGCGTLSAEGHQQQMLSFSSPTSQPLTLPYYHYTSNAFGRNTGGNDGSMQGVRGPFTPSQWMELEHQALIYKYITANLPIPSYLLNPIRKAFDSAGFSVLRSSALGWSGFQLGFSNSDPEPGRCRRTDGKKWRCSRDAVVDQKYCERHMNRGRHRSRKPVEGQPGHSNANPKPASVNHLAGIPTISRAVVDKHKVEGATLSKATAREDQYKQPNAFQEFGLVCSDSLLNPLSRSSSQQQAALRQFMDEWPKNQSDPSSWPDLDMQQDRTQLSISIPMVTSDFMSSTSSPTNDNLTASPPRELEMGLGVGVRNQRQASWVPISNSIGGPLGEALHNKQLNLIDSWDNSPRLASSPTGVLQRGPFVSLSNSSAASSPRSSHCNGILNAGLVNPSLPAL